MAPPIKPSSPYINLSQNQHSQSSAPNYYTAIATPSVNSSPENLYSTASDLNEQQNQQPRSSAPNYYTAIATPSVNSSPENLYSTASDLAKSQEISRRPVRDEQKSQPASSSAPIFNLPDTTSLLENYQKLEALQKQINAFWQKVALPAPIACPNLQHHLKPPIISKTSYKNEYQFKPLTEAKRNDFFELLRCLTTSEELEHLQILKFTENNQTKIWFPRTIGLADQDRFLLKQRNCEVYAVGEICLDPWMEQNKAYVWSREHQTLTLVNVVVTPNGDRVLEKDLLGYIIPVRLGFYQNKTDDIVEALMNTFYPPLK